jgi:hypothetical protein
MILILNSLAQYFYMLNESLPKYEDYGSIDQKAIYVIFQGNTPRFTYHLKKSYDRR